MALQFVTELPGCRDALERGLKALEHHPTFTSLGRSAAVTNHMAPPPLPVYDLPLDDLEAQKTPILSEPIAWEYLLVVDGQAARTAEVQLDLEVINKPFVFGSISKGAAAGLAKAIQIASDDPASATGRFEMRLVKAPSLYITALWLKGLDGAADSYVVVSPAPEGFRANVVISSTQFFGLLYAKAEEKKLGPAKQENSMSN